MEQRLVSSIKQSISFTLEPRPLRLTNLFYHGKNTVYKGLAALYDTFASVSNIMPRTMNTGT